MKVRARGPANPRTRESRHLTPRHLPSIHAVDLPRDPGALIAEIPPRDRLDGRMGEQDLVEPGHGLCLLSLALGVEGSPLFVSPWWLAFTAFFTFAIMLSLLVFIFEGIRDAFDPRKTFN